MKVVKVEKEKIKRLENAVKYLISQKLVDGRAPVKSIAEKMDWNKSNVSSAMSGDDRYFTKKFIIDFCATYDNIISSDWILTGEGVMSEVVDCQLSSDSDIEQAELKSLTKDQLILIIKELIHLYNEQSEMYRMVIRRIEETIRNCQERFNNINNIAQKSDTL